jgi:hypothetical protein
MKTCKPLLALSIALMALPADAQDFGGVFGQPLPLVAQMSQEERRALRERWEQASPEERVHLRRMFQERLRRMPPEQLDPRGMGERLRESWQEQGYGTGYEQRRYEDDQYDAHRGGFGDERRSRGRR